jgi:hydrogenase nickel incorporation protein HypA/HybF
LGTPALVKRQRGGALPPLEPKGWVNSLHELGIMFNVVRSVESFARANGVAEIDTLVLQIGELSPVVPHFIEACYPAAVDGTLLQETKLKIEIIPGNAMCSACGKVFNLLADGKKCPHCGAGEWEIISGKEFMIKEIIAC